MEDAKEGVCSNRHAGQRSSISTVTVKVPYIHRMFAVVSNNSDSHLAM